MKFFGIERKIMADEKSCWLCRKTGAREISKIWPLCKKCAEDLEKANTLYKITEDPMCYEGIRETYAKTHRVVLAP